MNSLSAVTSSSILYAAKVCGSDCRCASCVAKQSQLSSTNATEGSSQGISVSGQTAVNGEPLTAEQLAQVQQLAARDREVRQHEQAHLAASGGLAKGGASYSMQKGPDGKVYAVGGEVSIDTSAGKSPEETIRKARIIQAAALAPADPSGQDRAVAAAAQAMELQAQAEIAQRSGAQQKLADVYATNDVPKSGWGVRA